MPGRPPEPSVGLRNFRVLLHGEFVFYLADGTQGSLTYNAASFPLVERMLDFVSRQIAGAPNVPRALARVPGVVDPFFQTLVREHLARHPGSTVVFCEEPGVRYRARGWRRHRSLGLLVLRTDTEWLFFDRGSAVAQVSESAYAGSTTWVPLTSAPRLEWIEGPDGPPAGRFLSVRVAGQTLEYRVFSDPGVLEELKAIVG